MDNKRCRRVFIYTLTAIMIVGGILSMFIIAANKTVTEQRAWSGYFVFFILQDIIIIPLAYMAFHYALSKMVRMHKFRMNPPLHYRLYTQLNRDLEAVFVKIYYLE